MGSIVPGWVLLIPKRDVFSFRALTAAELVEARRLVEQLSATLSESFGPVSIFEHGASRSGSVIGCGVDHAHLHLVPLKVDLLSAAIADKSLRWHALSHWSDFPQEVREGDEYLLVADSTGKAYVSDAAPPTGQYFRKVVASLLGRPAHWDYRAYPFAENAEATLRLFGNGNRLLLADAPDGAGSGSTSDLRA
jgi:diadenosine tetraphosphate (Ap4A) HIT family hydrolase